MNVFYCRNDECCCALADSDSFEYRKHLVSPGKCLRCHPKNFAGKVVSIHRRLFGRVEVRIHQTGYRGWHYYGRRRPFMMRLATILSPDGEIMVNGNPLRWNIYQGFSGQAAKILGFQSASEIE